MEHQFVIRPEWNPPETAPKDRPIVLAMRHVNFETGAPQISYSSVFWGRMLDYPDSDETWIPLYNQENATSGYEAPYRHVVYYVEEHGRQRKLEYYRGSEILGWAEPWNYSIIISPPASNQIQFELTDKHC